MYSYFLRIFIFKGRSRLVVFEDHVVMVLWFSWAKLCSRSSFRVLCLSNFQSPFSPNVSLHFYPCSLQFLLPPCKNTQACHMSRTWGRCSYLILLVIKKHTVALPSDALVTGNWNQVYQGGLFLLTPPSPYININFLILSAY